MKSFRSKSALACAMAVVLGAAQIAMGVGLRPTVTRPPNDDCANAKPVGNVTNTAFDTTRATFDGPGHYMVSPNVWYCYTATCTGCATISLAGSSFDTKLAVYDGCSCYPAEDKLIKANDDFDGQQSELSLPVTSGHQYLIEVGGFNASTMGQGLITISCDAQATRPANDNCSQAASVSDVIERPFDTTCATFDGEGRCMSSPNLWYRYTASRTGEVTVSLLGSEFDTKLAVYKGDLCYPKSEDLIECNDDYPGHLQSKVIFEATSGQKYLIEVGGYNADAVGQGVLSIASTGGPTPPPKDDCADAQAVGNVTNQPFDTRQATFDGPGHCMSSPNIWFRYTAAATGNVTVSLLGSGYDTMLAVYKGSTCYPKSSDMIECNDDFGDDRQSQVRFAATAGSQYLIEIGGYGSATGQGVLTITAEGVPPPPPPGDNRNDCSQALPIGEVTNLPFDTRNATFDGRAFCMVSPNIWYCYTASCTGDVTVTLSNVDYDTMLGVYKGCQCFPEDLIECNDDFGPGYASQVTFAAVSGGRYLIEVGGYALEKGRGLLTVKCEGAVTPDKPDLGDAPDSTNSAAKNMTAYPAGGPLGVKANYPTVHSGSGTGPYGPAHVNAEVVAHLGKKITRETEADSGADEDGVNNIAPSADKANQDLGDDGVVFPVNMPHCRWTTFDYVVNVVDPNVDMWVNVWCDWNRDGDWDDTLECTSGPAPEWAVHNQLLFGLPVGLNTLSTPAFLASHPESGPEEIWMRITLSEQPWKGGSAPGVKGNGGSGPQAKYEFGETEDYYFVPDVTFTICEDFNGDGVIDTSDLVAFTAAWLENCPE